MIGWFNIDRNGMARTFASELRREYYVSARVTKKLPTVHVHCISHPSIKYWKKSYRAYNISLFFPVVTFEQKRFPLCTVWGMFIFGSRSTTPHTSTSSCMLVSPQTMSIFAYMHDSDSTAHNISFWIISLSRCVSVWAKITSKLRIPF